LVNRFWVRRFQLGSSRPGSTRLWVIICCLAAAAAVDAGEGGGAFTALPDSLPTNYAVLGVRTEQAGTDTLRITSVFPESPAAKKGLRKGDRILAVDAYRIPSFEELGRYIRSLEPGSEIDLLLLREGQGDRAEVDTVITCAVTDRAKLYFLMGEQGREIEAEEPRHQSWSATADSLERAAISLVDRQGVRAEFDTLSAVLANETGRYFGDCRLRDIHFALANPLKTAQLATALASGFRDGDLSEYLAAAVRHLDLAPVDDEGDQLAARTVPEHLSGLDSTLLNDVLGPFIEADLLVQHAFAALSDSERTHLYTHVPTLLRALDTDDGGLDYEDSTRAATNIRTLRLAKEVDLSSLAAAATQLSRLAQPSSLKRIRKLAGKLDDTLGAVELPSTFQGTFLYAARTGIGWVLVGGKGDNYYGEDAAFIVDLGGDDTYVNNCGSPTFIARRGVRRQWSRLGVIIDYSGDDRYLGNSWGGVASGLAGVGMIVDLKGDDLYQGDQLTQGTAFCGVGMLLDKSGDDVYLAQSQAQAAAFFGIGLLVDSGGSDLYSSTLMSQGFGSSRGLGMLADRNGDDRYVADRKVPSSYGTPGVYSGWSQGVGWGIRGFTSGGIGLLLDRSGNDEYQAGNFSQGTGYFFGLGLLVDDSGDDHYRGSRYTQGASAHQAVGVLLDGAGDDVYEGAVAANQAGAWDAAISILEDRGGDDRYQGRGLSQGAAAMNGIGVLHDWSGRDRYASTSGQGNGGSTKYWGGRGAKNIGILIDEGGAEDEYDIAGRENDKELNGSRIGLFADH